MSSPFDGAVEEESLSGISTYLIVGGATLYTFCCCFSIKNYSFNSHDGRDL